MSFVLPHVPSNKSLEPTATRFAPTFYVAKTFRIEQRALQVAVAQLILVRCMKLFVFVFRFPLVACHSSSGTVQSVELIEYGTFRKTESHGVMSAPNAISGQMHAVVDAILIERTKQIHAQRGTSFGVRIKLIGEPEGLVVPCTAKCFHPKFTDPATGRSSEMEEWPNYAPIGRAGYIGYTFDNDWEIVPGLWTIQVFIGSQLKAEQSFTVIAGNASNKALERTATRFAFTFSMSKTLSLRATPAPGGHRSALSR
jgi:hypothetical protein